MQHERKFVVVGCVMLESTSAAGPGGGQQKVLDTAARCACVCVCLSVCVRGCVSVSVCV